MDAQTITQAVTTAETATHELRHAARRQNRRAGDPVTGSSPESPAPINLNLFDQAELIHYCLQGWAVITHEEQGDPLPADETPAMAGYLRLHAPWAAQQPWADDLVTELRDHAHTAEGMLGLLPRRIPVPEACKCCGHQQWAYPGDGEGGMILECVLGHVTAMRHVVGSTRVSIRGAQRILGIRRETIREALASGEVVNHGTDTRPIVDTQAIETYLTGRLRTHSL